MFARQTGPARRTFGENTGDLKMTTTNKKKNRLRLILIAAAALGSSSATMSGVMATMAAQHGQSASASVA